VAYFRTPSAKSPFGSCVVALVDRFRLVSGQAPSLQTVAQSARSRLRTAVRWKSCDMRPRKAGPAPRAPKPFFRRMVCPEQRAPDRIMEYIRDNRSTLPADKPMRGAR